MTHRVAHHRTKGTSVLTKLQCFMLQSEKRGRACACSAAAARRRGRRLDSLGPNLASMLTKFEKVQPRAWPSTKTADDH